MQHPVSVNTSETVEKLEHRAMVDILLFLIMAAIQESHQHVQVVESDDVCICICSGSVLVKTLMRFTLEVF